MNYFFIALSVVVVISIIKSESRRDLSIRESIFWFIGSILVLFLSLFPSIVDYLATLVGIYYPPSLLFLLGILFVLYINYRNSKQISKLQMKILDLTQVISILKFEVENRENKDKSSTN